MGVLSDFFTIPRAELPTLSPTVTPAEKYAVLDSKGIDTVKLATLHTILLGEDLNDIDAVVARQPPMILDGGNDGPWFFQIPADLIQELAAASPADLARIANTWFATEEFQLDRWPRSLFDQWFADFLALIRKTRQNNLLLILWMCL